MTNIELKNLIKKAPNEPGLYFFTDTRGRYLYIGKAASIKKRLNSYTRAGDTRIIKMVQTASSIKFLVTESEIEALIAESRHIKKHRPPFNIVMRDDKQYLSVGITKEKFPKIFLTHQPSLITDHWSLATSHIGPFTDATALKTTLRYLRRLFPYCTCQQSHHNFCLNYHIGKCPGYCCLKNNSQILKNNPPDQIGFKKNYIRNIKAIQSILNGKRTSLLKNLEKEMKQKSKLHNFEVAQELKHKIDKIKQIFENAKIIRKSDASNESLGGSESIHQLAKDLNLSNLPLRIEGYDVSNISGQYGVGAMVVFKNGQAKPDDYRKFKIRSIIDNNDTGMLREILIRRFNHPEWPYPDLIIIDGGKGQLSTAQRVIDEIKIKYQNNKSIEIIALTKDEHHRGTKIINKDSKQKRLVDLSGPSRNLIISVDTQAHRFAISYYRNLHRSKYSLK